MPGRATDHQVLGDTSVALMRGHGHVMVGTRGVEIHGISAAEPAIHGSDMLTRVRLVGSHDGH